MALHGVDNPDIRDKDSLAQDHAGDAEKYSLVLANPPFAGALDYEGTAKDLLAIVKTEKTEPLFLALFLRLLKPGGRAAVIVPEGVPDGERRDGHSAPLRVVVHGHQPAGAGGVVSAGQGDGDDSGSGRNSGAGGGLIYWPQPLGSLQAGFFIPEIVLHPPLHIGQRKRVHYYFHSSEPLSVLVPER